MQNTSRKKKRKNEKNEKKLEYNTNEQNKELKINYVQLHIANVFCGCYFWFYFLRGHSNTFRIGMNRIVYILYNKREKTTKKIVKFIDISLE